MEVTNADKKYKDQENATETLDRLIQQDSYLTNPLKQRDDENKELIKPLNENIYNENFNECTLSLKNLKDNTKQLKSLLNNLETKNTLSAYRDWITFFNKRLRGQVDANVWNKVQSAIYNKVNTEMANYSRSERDYVSKLEIALNNVHMTLGDYELLILMKCKSNCEFHGDISQTRAEARKKLDSSFPKNMEVFKNVLDKLFKALDKFDE